MGTSPYQALVTLLVVLAALAVGQRARGDTFGIGTARADAGVTAVAAGAYHNCALAGVGGVKCWGSNVSGQLGDAQACGSFCMTPVNVSGLTSGVAVIGHGGNGHTCAITATGGVKCWGQNDEGALGDGQVCGTSCTTPVDVTGLSSNVMAVAGNWLHTCAITTTGALKCWGDNSEGELGDGTTMDRTTPADVTGLSAGVAAVAPAHYHHTCALSSTGGLKCWGLNVTGQLGDGTTTSRTTPVDVTGLTSGVAAVSAGSFHTCAVTTAGGAKCWGVNGSGELGDGETCGSSCSTPLDVTGLTSNVAAIASGRHHTCAVTTVGAVKCWGDNQYGQLGDGTTTVRTTPVDVSGLGSGVSAISAGREHTCVLTTGGAVKCWGLNSAKQLGAQAGDTCAGYSCSTIPVEVMGLSSAAVGGIAVLPEIAGAPSAAGSQDAESGVSVWLIGALILGLAVSAGGWSLGKRLR